MKKALLLMMVLLVMGSMNVCGVNLNVPSTYATVGAAIAAANPSGGDVVLIAAGTLIEPGQIVIDKNLTIQGAGSTLTTLNPGFSTSVGGNLPSESFIYIPAGITATIKDLNIDCNGKIVSHAIQSRGSLVVDGCIIQNVISGQHTGRGIVFFSGTAGNLVNNVSFNNIGRIGIHVRGNVIIPNPVVTIQNITYTGKGVGDYLDYAVEFGGGGSGTVDNLNASNCLGVATSVDNSTSAGVLVTDYWGTGTQATITHSIFTNNTDAIHVGYGAGDLSTVVAHFNTFNGSGPSNGIEAVGLTSVNAIGNYWGSYPFVSGNVSFSPWYNTPAMTTQTYLTGTGTTIQAAIDAANSGDVILLTDEVHTEPAQIVVNKNITLSGISNVTTIIKPGVNTGSSGDNRGFILVQTGKTFNMDHIRIDGSGKLVNIGILSRGPGLIDHCAFSHIGYNPGGPDYAGRGVAFYDVNMIISNCSFDNIGRIGMYMYGAGVTSGQILNNTYTGKGSGNWLDYAVEIEGGAHGIITGNTISNCLGVAYDGSTSAGLLATTYFAPGTSADITDNIFNNNTTAIVAGYNSSDGTVLEVHHNTFTGVSPDNGISAVGLAQVDATGNYWGSILPNFIQRVYGDVDFSPYCNSDFSNCNLTVAEGPVTYAGKVITIPGQTQVTIPIKVTNFSDVDAISLRILYPSANLDFVSATSNGAFPGMAITSTGDTTVHIAWAGNNSAVTLPDNSVLCNLVFNVTGSGTFALNFDNRLQTNCEYQNHTTQMPYYDMPFADFYKSGYVKTGGAVAFTRQYPGIPSGNTDQKITAVPSGGTAPYTLFEWTGPLYTATGATIVPGGYGNYTVTITDTDGAVMSSTYHYNRVHNTISMLDYATIQGAIDAVQTVNGHVIMVDAGTYAENVSINKSVELFGAKAGVNVNIRSLAFVNGKADPLTETVITTPVNNPTGANPNANDLFRVLADNIIIDGFVFDGNNPSLGTSTVKNEDNLDIHARRGINNIAADNTTIAINQLEISNNIFQNLSQREVNLYSTGTIYNDILIQNNLFRNYGYDPAVGGQAVILFNNAYADIVGNTIVVPHDQIGIHSQNFSGNGTMTWSGNHLTVGQDAIGIHANMLYGTAGLINIDNNTVNAASGVTAASGFTWGINVWSVQVTSTVNVTQNNIGTEGGQFARGINLWHFPTTNFVTVNGGNIKRSDIGINVDNVDPYYGGAQSGTANINAVTITGGQAGIRARVEVLPETPLYAANTVTGSVTLNINAVSISEATYGIVTRAPSSSGTNYSNVRIDNSFINQCHYGFLLSGSNGNLISASNDYFTNHTGAGINIEPLSGSVGPVSNSDLSGNPAGNAILNGKTAEISATCNWWGSSSAATVFDQKTGPVYFAPWLTDGTDNDLLAAGFQPANGTCSGMPVHNLTKDTYHLTIQDAVNVADPANVIECAEYTYREKVQIDKSISLHGVDSVNCIIDGTGLGAGYGITLASGVTNTSISFFTIRNHNGGITALGGNNFLTIQYCTLQNNVGAHGFLCNSPVNNVVIDHVNSFGHTGGVRGIVFWGTGLRDHVSITNCHVYNNNCCGIELQDGTGTDVYLANNYVHDNGDNGIGLMGLKGPGVNIIEKNTLRNNGRFGIEIKNPNGSGLSTGNASIVVQNNNITFTPSVTMDSRDHAGIAAFRRSILTNNSEGYPNIPTGVVIQNNTVSGYTQMNPAHGESEGFGIVIEGTNNTVAGNSVSGCDVGIQQQGGGHPNANYVPDNAGDGDQNTGFSAAYFGRGNSPVACGNNISGNTLSSNTLNARNSGPYNGDGYLRNVSNGETFCTFQTAIDDVHTLAGHQINASAGTYKENVIVNKPVVLNGSGIDISIVHPAISAPMEGASGSLPAGSSNVFLVQANNVTIRNLTINGDNPSLTSGVIRLGEDIDARNGIITNHNLGTFNDLNVNNTAIKNIYLRGVYASSSGSFSFGNNIIENIQGESQSIAMMNWGGTGSMTNNAVSYCNDGIVSNHSTGVTYSGNTVTHSGTGIHTDNNGDSGGTADVIHNNTVSDGTSGSYGIFVFASHLNTEVSENNVTGVMVGLCAAGQSGGIPEFSRNTVTNTTYGIFTTTSLFGWGSSSSQSSFLNNIIDNNTTAITLEAETGQSNSTLINNNHITGSTTMLTIDGDGTGSYNVNCNWWGAADASTVVATVGVPYTVADFSPWLTSGTDASGDPGFQPVPNSCNGLPALTGNINYFNTGSTPLNNVVVKLWQGNQEKYSTTSLANGSYTFAGVDAGQYNVRFAATKPTNGAVNATDAAQVNYWSANHTGIERIRFMAGDVAGAVSGSTTVGDKTVSSADASRIINYFVTMGTPAFDTNWVFWKTSDLISNNPNNAGTLAVEVTGQNLTKDFYGMARGDFNRSFEPGSAKLAADRLRLEISGSINPVPGETFELPVYASSSMDITAISMILNHPAGILEVLGVYLGSDKNQPLQFAVHGDELRIGWMSETPVMLAAGDRLVTLKLRITGTTGTPIRLSLAGDNLNELAGADYDPINADLHTHEISAPAGTPDVPGSDAMTLTNHPNPFREQTLFTYTLPASGHVTLDIYNLMGSKIITIVDTDQVSGEHSVTLKGDFAASGVYVANLKLVANGKEFNRIIKIVANR